MVHLLVSHGIFISRCESNSTFCISKYSRYRSLLAYGISTDIKQVLSGTWPDPEWRFFRSLAPHKLYKEAGLTVTLTITG